MNGMCTAEIAYVRDTGERPRYYANAHEKDTIVLAPQPMAIADMRGVRTSLDIEGCVLVPHRSEVADFADPEQVSQIHLAENLKRLRSHLSGIRRESVRDFESILISLVLQMTAECAANRISYKRK